MLNYVSGRVGIIAITPQYSAFFVTFDLRLEVQYAQ